MKKFIQDKIKWWREEADKTVTVIILVLHLLALCAMIPWLFSWSGVKLCVILYFVTGFGITLCFHRLLTHQAFKTPKWVRFILTCCGCLACQNSPIVWIGTHRYHHQHSDTDEDPHSPKHGFTWAHIVWVITKSPNGFDGRYYAKDLQKEPMMQFLDRFFWLPQLVLIISLLVAGYCQGGYQLALSWLVWGVGVRTVAVFHNTWFVNSACHTWGYRSFETGEGSRNNWWVGIISLGEGWHNNHHGEPYCAAHGRRWYEIDLTYYLIVLMSWLWLASDVRKPKKLPP